MRSGEAWSREDEGGTRERGGDVRVSLGRRGAGSVSWMEEEGFAGRSI